ncbi:hypothetical protein N8T08_000663 [Aspergillus melleus]|uniref:Uncharacterized protein n=1 Tax=Aspergillus melleus TaxID=138277 RepID=A0ACC3AQ05_9EURO|nr:hypothetical protein N8T08_000663 [Aspergillus melleus]
MCNSQTTKYTLCGCIVSKAPMVCELGESCPSHNKMKIAEEDSLCLECFTNAGGQVRWWGLLKKLDLDVEGVDEGLKEEDGDEEEEEMEKDQAQSDSEESEESGDSEEGEEEEDEESPDKGKDKAGLPEPNFGVDVSRDCYPPAVITLAYLQQRKEERREAEVEKLKMLYGEDYYEGF